MGDEARALLAQAERWTDPTTEGATELEDAKRFLADLLADGPLPAKTIKADADGAGYSWITVRRAADVLGVKKAKEGFGETGIWKWVLPKVLKNPLRCSSSKDEHLKVEMSILGDEEVL